ncbi:MAG: hypothetical protein CMK89_07405 [Pseudomonadales bacterium]|nr:hypothetical protein [Pseudomonadales bacterium]
MAKPKSNVKKQPKKYALQGSGFPQELANAKAFLAAQEPQKAVALYQRILQKDPMQLHANYSLAMVLHRSGRNDAALMHVGRVVAQQPEHIDSQVLLGNVLLALGRQQEALQNIRKLADLYPREDAVFMALGNVEESCGHLDAAIRHWDKAFSLNRKQVPALVNQARVRSAQGDVDAALTLLRRARALKPGYGECHYRIAMLAKQTAYSEDIKLMESAAQQGGGTRQDKMYLAHALGKVFDDLQEYDKAFRYLQEGNDLRKQSLPQPYSGELEQAQFNQIKSLFSGDFIQRYRLAEEAPFTPVFVVGMPRSGTSLVEQILASHSKVFGAGELQDMNEVITRLQTITAKPFPEGLDQLSATHYRTLAARYVERVSTETDKSVIVDKMPHNFRYLGLIAVLFPNARIIHCQRDPMDTCFSIYKQLFSESHPYACDQAALGHYYRLYQDLIAHWSQVMPDKILNLQYEDLVAETEQKTRQMLAFCGLEFEPDCLSFFTTRRIVNTPSQAQVRQPIYKSAVHHWQHYEEQLQRLKSALDN